MYIAVIVYWLQYYCMVAAPNQNNYYSQKFENKYRRRTITIEYKGFIQEFIQDFVTDQTNFFVYGRNQTKYSKNFYKRTNTIEYKGFIHEFVQDFATN